MPTHYNNGPGDKKKNGDKKKTVKMTAIKKKRGSKGPGMGNLKSHDQLHEKGLRAAKHAFRKGYSKNQAKKINTMVSEGVSPNQAEKRVFNKFYNKKKSP